MNDRTNLEWLDKNLSLAVPMWIDELRQTPVDILKKKTARLSTLIGERGDILLYGTKKPGKVADVFNRLAEGIACLCLITKAKVPFGKLVFSHEFGVKKFDSEKEASEFVWPKNA